MCICLSVGVSVCLCVCSLLWYRLNVFLPPLPEFRCPIFLKILNSWGKVMERSCLRTKKKLPIKGVKLLQIGEFRSNKSFSLSQSSQDFEVLLKGLFAPTSQSRMYNIFRDLEFLGKSNGKQWSRIWKRLLINGVKSPH